MMKVRPNEMLALAAHAMPPILDIPQYPDGPKKNGGRAKRALPLRQPMVPIQDTSPSCSMPNSQDSTAVTTTGERRAVRQRRRLASDLGSCWT